MEKIDHRYRVLEQLGSGLSGEIFKVEGPEGLAALKLLRTEVPGLHQEEAIATFKFEFSLLKGLKHPNIIQIFDFGFDEALQRFYFTQELIDGFSLQEETARMGLKEVQELFIQALQGLSYLHAHQVIHGDLKPENLLVTALQTKQPLLKIIDFGISHPRLVQFAGTPAYLAPEKILREPTDPRSDLYSLAVVFYTLLTGENPFQRETTGETLRAQLHFVPPSATTRRPELNPVWSELLSLMLKKNPRHRIASAEACLKFLETQGEVQWAPERPHDLPPGWIGRKEILDQAKEFLDGLSVSKKNRWLLIVGEAGLGKNHLLTELKYEAELQKMEVLTEPHAPTRPPATQRSEKKTGGQGAIRFLKTEETQAFLGSGEISSLLEHSSLISAVDPLTLKKFSAEITALKPKILQLRPLTREEAGQHLREVTRNREIPEPFLNTLFRLSGGYPAQLHEVLLHLLKDPRIMETSGKWNLAIFHEAQPSIEQLGLSESGLAHALASPQVDDPKERWELGLQRANVLAIHEQMEEALRLLQILEKEIPKLYAGDARLLQRGSLLEKRGWVYSKQGRYQEAREAFASALSLLKERETPEPVLEIRLKNFSAFLDLQEGKVEAAIKQFEKTSLEAVSLKPEQHSKITNNELGNAYLAAGKIPEGIRQLKKDLEFYENLPDPFFKMKASYNLAEAHTKAKNFPEAQGCYERVMEIGRQERQWDYLLRAYNGLGNAATLQARSREALDYYQRGLALSEYLRDYLSAATVAQNRGVILSEIERLDEALHDLDISKRLLSKVQPSSHSRYLMARATLELGEVHLKKKDYAKARSFFSEALNRCEEDPNLKAFAFYPLASLAKLSLHEGEFENFREIYPRLVHLANEPEEKKILAKLLSQSPADPGRGLEQGVAGSQKEITQPDLSQARFSMEPLLSILKINRAMITEYNPEVLFQKILEYASELSEAESALLLETDERGELQVRAAFNTEVDQGLREISHQVAQKVLSSGKSIVTHDAMGDEGFKQFQSVIALHLRSIACIPIRLHQKVIGLLYLTHRYKTKLFRPEMIQILEAFGDQAGLALQNARQVQRLKEAEQGLKVKLQDAEEEIDQLRSDLRSKVKNPYPKILGKSRAIVEILQNLDRISDTNLSVLILGETGTGKELVARAIHENSRRHRGPFVAVNCAAIPENLLESELFGYLAGAFTGAIRDKKGLLEEAQEGTVFLDEVAELPTNMQVKLLRALQEREVQRLGAAKPTPIDIRVLAATHREIEGGLQSGEFRDDLYYRVAQMILQVPPLRNRKEDLPLLCEHFSKVSAKDLELKNPPRLGKDLLHKMMEYPWPGNVRELENFIRTASAFAERGVIHEGNLPAFLLKKLEGIEAERVPTEKSPKLPSVAPPTSPNSPLPYFPDWEWRKYEEALFAKALLRHDMNCEKVAEELGVGVATVYVKIRKFGLKNKLKDWESAEINFPVGITLPQLKNFVIQKSYEQNQNSPYATAKKLDLNVGTVYRQLKSVSRGNSTP